jgi:hypothetical protein
MYPADFSRSGRLVHFQVSPFRSTVVTIGDDCCSVMLVLWGLSTGNSCLSTIISSTKISFA